MTTRTLTTEEALAIFADENADFLPFHVLNETGKAAIREWLAKTANSEHNESAWFEVAEDAADNATAGESIIIEMHGMHTRSGNPETLNLSAQCFEWMINQ